MRRRPRTGRRFWTPCRNSPATATSCKPTNGTRLRSWAVRLRPTIPCLPKNRRPTTTWRRARSRSAGGGAASRVLGGGYGQRRCGPRSVQLDIQTQLVRRVGIADRLVIRNVAVVIELEQGPIEGPHTEFPRLPHDRLDLVKLSLEYFLGNDRRVYQDLHGCLASLAVDGADQAL